MTVVETTGCFQTPLQTPLVRGHAAGLNAALERLSFFPPALPPEPPEAALHVSVHRVIERTIATPEGAGPRASCPVTVSTFPLFVVQPRCEVKS